MLIKPLGKAAVAVPGTVVLLSVLAGVDHAQEVIVRALPGTNPVYVGSPTMVRATFVGVVARLIVPAATGLSDEFRLCSADDDGIDLRQLAIDADTATDGPLVTIVVL